MQFAEPFCLQDNNRANGLLKLVANGTGTIEEYKNSGASKGLFPNRQKGLECILINTGGGLTGGDRISFFIDSKEQAEVIISTQGFERIYKTNNNSKAIIQTNLNVLDQALLYWVPQETLLYNNGQLERQINVNLSKNAQALILEGMIYGRIAMGELSITGSVSDTIKIQVENKTVFQDRSQLSGQIGAQLDRPAVANGARATALLVYKSKDAPRASDVINRYQNHSSGVTLFKNDLCVARFLAQDGYALRKMLLPILQNITKQRLPKPWLL